jgi:integrase
MLSTSLAQGTPLHVVSEVLGHASIAITKDVYGQAEANSLYRLSALRDA